MKTKLRPLVRISAKIITIAVFISINCLLVLTGPLSNPEPLDEVFWMDEFEEAIQIAQSEDCPVVFLFSSEGVRCPVAHRATENVINELKESNLIIFFDVKIDSFEELPKIVQKGFMSWRSGTYLPKAIITSPDLKRVIAIVPFVRSNQKHIEILKKANHKITHPRKPIHLILTVILISMGLIIFIVVKKRRL